MKNILIIGAAVGFLFLIGTREPEKPQPAAGDIVSAKGIHWHPELSIIIRGEKQSIPANIGIGMQYAGHPHYDRMMRMTDMHTHDATGVLHWEVMAGPVTTDDIRLRQFFSVWGKQFTHSCIFDFCNGPQGRLFFKVNGEEHSDFEEYPVQDGDKIEIIFERPQSAI